METDLRRLRDELHRTLQRMGADDPTRPEIERLAAAVEQRLHSPDSDDLSFAETLQEASLRFEADHPSLGSALRTLINELGAAGI